MSITREDVADLRPGDVVEFQHPDWGTSASGAVYLRSGEKWVAGFPLSYAPFIGGSTLTVVSRAPRPLYVNHPRTEPVPGDVVRQEGGCPPGHTWHYLGDDEAHPARWWRFDDTRIPFDENARLHLLVDGETGQVVP